ncbi:hypothetical protein GCM10017714_21950 [Curtobacterium pusillum]|uniref:Bacterial Ig domain-containing protein n=1 Tax=Curtobacterium pusillum TaxID=69373 RepID=A0ABX2M8C8_9MICO|nr:hypothetical protein [Curtobacterium pusillum]NUU14312.1 hypothetical protein [Curtobacterium pusillum]GLK32056.1 hypothetical protein GCM10017610_23410 [Curtobacterium pusillum]
MQKHREPPRLRSVSAAAALVTVAATALTSGPAAAGEGARGDSEAQIVGPLVTETSSFQGAATFSAPAAPATGAEGAHVPANRALTLAAARATAVRWYLPAAGSVTPVRPATHPDLCLTAQSATAGPGSSVTLERCDAANSAQQFRQASNATSNNPIGTGLQSVHNDGFLGLYNNDDVMRLQAKSIADRVPTIGDFIPDFSARVDGVNALARMADVSGRGTPGATVVINGTQRVSIRATGEWEGQVSDLAFGPNTIALEQVEGGQQTGTATLTAELLAEPLTFTATFAAERDLPVTAAGRGHPGATVKLFDGDGHQIGTAATANQTTGAWSTNIPAPNAGGEYQVIAAQFLSGLRDGAHDVSSAVDYGSAVSVDAPQDGAVHTGGSLEMSGTGEPGAAVEVHEVTDAGDRLVGRSRDGVAPNGRWTLTTDDLDRAEHVLRVVQKSRGANTTTTTVTVNPGETGKLTPVQLSGPALVTPGLPNRFHGTAEPGATYEVLNVSNTPIVPGPLSVSDDGHWEFERVVSTGARNFQFKIRQSKDGQTETSPLFVIDANEGVTPVIVSTETVLPGMSNTFEGTGPAGATYEVLNASGNQIVPGTQTIGDDGTWSFDRDVSAGVLTFSFKLRITLDGSTYTTKLFELPASTR